MTRLSLLITFLGVTFSILSQTKHAILVGIADYPYNKKNHQTWNDLSSDNDLVIIEKMLLEQQFKSENINILKDADATTANLSLAFQTLSNKLKKDDIVFFHFSGHGQQISDVNGKRLKIKNKQLKADETDGLDEALVMYNAPLLTGSTFKNVGYSFENHFVDDQLNYYITNIRNKIGANGQVIVVIDACHSGTATRGEDEAKVRGSKETCGPATTSKDMLADTTFGFGTDFSYNLDEDAGKLVAFFGCKAEQVNREITSFSKGYGSLSWFLVKAMKDLDKKASYSNLFSEIRKHMVLRFNNNQHPEIEGDDLNQLIFSGDFIAQEPFFTLSEIDVIDVGLNAGQIDGLLEGDSIVFLDNTATSPEGQKPFRKGVVTKSSINSCMVSLDEKISRNQNDPVLYRAFKTSDAIVKHTIKVKIDLKSTLKSKFENKFNGLENIVLVKKDYDYVICEDKKSGGVVIKMEKSANEILRNMDPISKESGNLYDSVLLIINEASKLKLLRKLEFENPDYDFEIIVKKGKNQVPISEADLCKLKQGDIIYFYVRNTGTEDFFMHLYNLTSDGKVEMETYENSDRIKPGKRVPANGKEVKIAGFRLSKVGMDQYNFIASYSRIDLTPIYKLGTDLSKASTRGGEDNPFLSLINENMSGTRGDALESAEMNLKSLIFDVKPKK